MVSLSIDLNRDKWLQLFPVHNIDWPQLIIAKEKIEEVQDIFGFTTIPFLLFTDNKGTELARFADYDPDNTRRHIALTRKFIK